MIKIRLTRGGAKLDPFYKIVAIEKDRKREGRPLEVIGHWHPKKNLLKIDKDRLESWVAKGAKVSSAVGKLLK